MESDETRPIWAGRLKTVAVLALVFVLALILFRSCKQATQQPQLSGSFAMAYDGASRQLVLYGGVGTSTPALDRTWIWDSTSWQALKPVHHPQAPADSLMAYDEATSQLLLFIGAGADGQAIGATWLWTGADWTELHPAHHPAPRIGAAMAYDGAMKQLVLFGGLGAGRSNSGKVLSDTWTWTGTDWLQLHPANHPPALAGSAMAYDPGSGKLVLFGGVDSGLNDVSGTWAWTDNGWSELHPANHPPPLEAVAMAYDTAPSELVLFGGDNPSGVGTGASASASASASGTGSGKASGSSSGSSAATVAMSSATWVWNGTTWSTEDTMIHPPGSGALPMAYYPPSGTDLLVDASARSDSDIRTWSWSNTGWDLVGG